MRLTETFGVGQVSVRKSVPVHERSEGPIQCVMDSYICTRAIFKIYRGATISFVGRHNTAIVDTKRPLPAKYSTALLPLLLLNRTAAISGPEIPSRLPKNDANPVAVPRIAVGNASGVHPKSYDGIFQRTSGKSKIGLLTAALKRLWQKYSNMLNPI